MNESLNSIFPRIDEVPEIHRIVDPIEQRQYLSNGIIKEWRGQRQDVFSPVCIRSKERIQQKRIGSYPLLTEKEALESLEAACRAYDHG